MYESQISNARYAVGDGDGGQRRATSESIISNACHAIRDSEICYFSAVYLYFSLNVPNDDNQHIVKQGC